MKTKLLLLLGLLLLAFSDVSQADARRGRWRGDWDDGRRWRGDVRWRGDWDGGRRWRGDWDGGRRWRSGWGWRDGWGVWGPSFGVGFVAPLPIYSNVYVSRPARSYVTYSAPRLYRAQARLARLGYNPGPIDGAFGPMTSRAIRNYQIDYGLPVTGRLDYRTQASLGV